MASSENTSHTKPRTKSGAGNDLKEIGTEIRRLRKARKLTLSQLSDKTGISVSHLSQIERNLSSPTINFMVEISHALKVHVEWFIDAASNKNQEEAYIVRAGDRKQLKIVTGITEHQLSTPNIERFEVMLSEFAPGSNSGAEPFRHEGEKSGLVLSGKLELTIDGVCNVLNEGDSFSFPSTLNHSYRNPYEAKAMVIWITSPPILFD